MKKIAIILDSNFVDKKGYFNSVHNRAKELKKNSDFIVDVYLIQTYENFFFRKCLRTEKRKKEKISFYDSISYNNLWYNLSLIDCVLLYKLHYTEIFKSLFIHRQIDKFKNYDLISTHSTYCASLGYMINKKYNIPFTITWHGSDIHSIFSKKKKQQTKKYIESAFCNFFVSKALLSKAQSFATSSRSEVLYNAASDSFVNYSSDLKKSIKEKFGIKLKKVVAFVGNIYSIKNVKVLPDIFSKLSHTNDVVFWIIGDGKERLNLEKAMKAKKIEVTFFGNISPSKMNDFYNSIDVLVLPSLNEGLPLVCVEALTCGCNVVGSNVGGISEVIGQENVFNLDENFIQNITNRIELFLRTDLAQTLLKQFNWTLTSKKEISIYKECLNLKKI